jgi:uncharacterized membrane protein
MSIRAPIDRVFAAARDVERWPAMLAHYRWVRFVERRWNGGRVEMAAWRPFGAVRYPTWWVSEMIVLPAAHEVRYRHVEGVTRGMEVVWRLSEGDGGVNVEIVHEWRGPAWPLIGRAAADFVIGPVFIHGIASRTLAGIKRFVEGGR